MFEKLSKALKRITFGEAVQESYDDDDPRLAAAAILFHVIAVDGHVDLEEQNALANILANRFSLTQDEVAKLIEEAQQKDNEAIDLYGFTSTLKRAYTEDQRRQLISMMWELVYADGQAHEFEDNTVWRVSELLGISARERVLLRKSARGEAAGSR